MIKVSSPLVGKDRKQNDYITLPSGLKFAEFIACEEQKIEMMKFFFHVNYLYISLRQTIGIVTIVIIL